MEESGSLNACIIGHSFVKRLNSCLSTQANGARDVALEVPRILRLNKLYNRIQLFGHNGYTVPQLRQQVLAAGRQSPDVVVINCGSNDICDVDCKPEDIANALVAYANLLTDSFGVKRVVIVGVIRRERCRGITAEEFSRRAHELNGVLKAVLANDNKVKFCQLRGFWRTQGGEQLDVASYSRDGIHPGPSYDSVGFMKYQNNVRRILVSSASQLLKKW